MSRLALLALSLVTLSLAACSSARIVHDTQTGGTVALRGPRDGAQEKATVLMRDKCPNGHTVVEQREVPYGESSWSSTSSQNSSSRSGGGSAFTNASTSQKTEWQITFQCRGAQASAAPYVIRF